MIWHQPDPHSVVADPDAFLNNRMSPAAPTLLRNQSAMEQQGSISESADLLFDHTPCAAESVPREQQPAEAALLSEQAAQQRLITRIVQGETEVFASIVEQYWSLMFHCASLILRHPQSAEDAVQEAFLQAWHHLPGLRIAWLVATHRDQSVAEHAALVQTQVCLSPAVLS
jgi:hypothetical protein